MMKRKVMDKRGLEMAINTIVTMVLAIAVLLFMFLFFTDAGGEFLGKVKGHSSYSNVDIVVDNCNFYADTEAEYSYCCEKKDVKYLEDGEKESGKFNCLEVNERFGRVGVLNCEKVNC
jgi:uncharacterized protein YxeA